MYFPPSSVPKRLVLVHISAVVAIKLLLIRSVSSLNMTNAYLQHKCIVSEGKYQPGSVYEKNLNIIIRASSAGDFRSGFDLVFRGKGSNFVTLMYQCRGDSYGSRCRSCYTTALSAVTSL
ncbi:Gnk2-homologous domain [Arabidopsis suecica]|uniref:Gnk2-homologous domain n=1 Tax=Arabidopsis suecica TaxID=45249 RepID=A0A8T2F8C7_ARASU|nr:Gnk2-homologous domain [Arabidopsis suecica]